MQYEVETDDGTFYCVMFNPAESPPPSEGFVIQTEPEGDCAELAADDKATQQVVNPGCKCDVCRLKIPTDDTTDRSGTGPVDAQEQSLCVVCGKTFPTESCLAYHEQVAHDPEQEQNVDDVERNSTGAGSGNEAKCMDAATAADGSCPDQDNSQACQGDHQRTDFRMDLDDVLPGFAIRVGAEDVIKTEEVLIDSELPAAAAAEIEGLSQVGKKPRNVDTEVQNRRDVLADESSEEIPQIIDTEAHKVIKIEEVHIFSGLAGSASPLLLDENELADAIEDFCTCYVCPLFPQFEDQNALEMHLSSVHMDQQAYNCETCTEAFDSISVLNRHLSQHEQDNLTYTSMPIYSTHEASEHCCPICDTKFPSESNVELHMYAEHRDFCKCFLCDKSPVFANKAALDAHLATAHSGKETYLFDGCNIIVSKKADSQPNQDIAPASQTQEVIEIAESSDEEPAPSEERPLVVQAQARDVIEVEGDSIDSELSFEECAIKTEEVDISSELPANEYNPGLDGTGPGITKATNKSLRCYLCSSLTLFERKDSLEEHLRVKHVKQPSYNCDACGKEFFRVTSYNKHLSRHDGGGSLRFKCSVCSIVFAKRGNKIRHEAAVHKIVESCKKTEKNLFKCYICSTTPQFRGKAQLDEHLSAAHPLVHGVKFTCRECLSIKYTSSEFNTHLARHDPDKRPYKCSICTMRFSSKSMLWGHERYVHRTKSTDKNRCFICECEFVNKESLQLHLCTAHLEPRAYSVEDNTPWCMLCQPTTMYGDQAALKQHLATVHPTLEPYTCQECNITIRGNAIVNLHRLRHDETLCPFRCSVCPARFKKLKLRMRHERLIHNIRR